MGTEEPNPKVTLSADAIAQRIGDEMVVVHLRTNQIYSLNSTATRVWDLLVSGLSVSEIKAQIVDEYEIGEAELEREISNLINEMSRGSLLDGSSPS